MKKYIILFLFIVALTACKKSYFDINNNPNAATDENITPDLLLTNALNQSGNIGTGITGRYPMLGRWLGIWSPGTNFAASDESKYQAATNTSNGDWQTHYDNIYDYQVMFDKATAANQNFYIGIAKIMKAWNYQQLVDKYNNVPYTQAANPTIIQPKYDKGADIYADLFKEITSGIELIKGSTISDNRNIAIADIMFKGDKVKWAKFGNTLKLRLLIHQSQVANIAAQVATEIPIITAEGSGFLNAGENAGVNPGYNADRANPYWLAHMYGAGCTPVPDNFNRANNFSLNSMKALNDIRYQYFYLPVRGTAGTSAADWKGIDYAPTNSDPDFTEGKLSDIGGARLCTGATAEGLGKSATMDSWILLAFESLFLQSEANARGWLATGSAQDLYNRAVTESFVYLNVPNATTVAATYLAQSDSRIAWPASPADRYKVITYQKYFAFNGNNHLEIWNDYRRLGAVNIALSVDPGRGSNGIPVRLLYPQTEYSFNAANVNAEGTINAFTSKVFWNQ